jgi:hypothetical protein
MEVTVRLGEMTCCSRPGRSVGRGFFTKSTKQQSACAGGRGSMENCAPAVHLAMDVGRCFCAFVHQIRLPDGKLE